MGVIASSVRCSFRSTSQGLDWDDADLSSPENRTSVTTHNHSIGVDEGAEISSGTPAAGGVTFTLDSLIIEPSPPDRAAYQTDRNGTTDSNFRIGGGVIIMDSSDGGRVTAVNLRAVQIIVSIVSVLDTGGAGPHVAVPANEYRVNAGTLEWNGLPLVSTIEDL